MRIAILGGGLTGLTAAYYLSPNHNITVYEKNKNLGGLASGFNPGDWEWPLDYAYHHIFSSDTDILSFAKEIGFTGFRFYEPETASLYRVNDDYRTFPVDTPQDFLRFPLLSLPEKIRAGVAIAAMRFGPKISMYDHLAAEKLLQKTMGERAYNLMLGELLRKKFGKYAGNITASFPWARLKKRTKSLGYPDGGFQAFTDYVVHILQKEEVAIRTAETVTAIHRKGSGYTIETEQDAQDYELVVSTLPTPVLTHSAKHLFSDQYTNRLNSLAYLDALVFIIETKEPVLERTYWLNVCEASIPIMLVCQHTNMIDKKHYGNNHVAYVGYYLEPSDRLMGMSDRELQEYIMPHLQNIAGNRNIHPIRTFVWKARFAQPIFNETLAKNKPDFVSPAENFHIANLDMTYPYDRGTNYAVKLGREVAELINKG